MKRLEQLIDEITHRANISLRELGADCGDYIRSAVPLNQFLKFYAFYGISASHPIHFHFGHSSLAGSYFLGKCQVDNSILYKADVRGDELKRRGSPFLPETNTLKLRVDERIRVDNSFLIKTLVHNFSHDPEMPDLFPIQNTVSAPYANIHGAPMRGCFLGPFTTVDLTTTHGCEVGAFSYIQTGELAHDRIESGTVWIQNECVFSFIYQYPYRALRAYVDFSMREGTTGLFMNFVEEHKPFFQKVFDVVHLERSAKVHRRAALNRYAVIRGRCHIGENVLVAQRAYLENAHLGKGSNAQENCYIIDAHLEGFNVTAHGGKIMGARLGEKVFVGFNSFLRGSDRCPLTIGRGTIVMPHTIVDIAEPLTIPADHVVWGLIRNEQELRENIVAMDDLVDSQGFRQGRATFQGSGQAFVEGFRNRIEHILLANGAYFDGKKNKGHAQEGQDISFNIIQPFTTGLRKGLYPTIDIRE